MFRFLPLVLLLCLCFCPGPGGGLQAQIYADVSLKHGTSALGTFRMELFHSTAPRAVANFIGLATGERNWIDPRTGSLQTNRPYYDGLTFHRLIHNFMIQGGDPLGSGTGGPGYVFQDEFEGGRSHQEYMVSMANSGACSNGSQFFITLSAPTWLDNLHTIFGQVIDHADYPNSRSLIDGFKSSANFPTGDNDLPDTPITIESIAFSGPDLASFDIHDPTLGLPAVSALAMRLEHDAENGNFSLVWPREAYQGYPLYTSTDLTNWNLAGHLLSMDQDPDFQVDITNIATGSKGFYQSCQIDYSALPRAPQNLLASGTVLELSAHGGTLRLNFDGAGGGSWTFIYADGSTPEESGVISQSGQTGTDTIPIIPTSDFRINPNRTDARYLPVRQVTAFLEDGPAGPYGLTAVQPILSFHAEASGWYDGIVNSDTPLPAPFRGAFTIQFP